MTVVTRQLAELMGGMNGVDSAPGAATELPGDFPDSNGPPASSAPS